MVPNGCVGAGIWTSPTVDPRDGSIYVTHRDTKHVPPARRLDGAVDREAQSQRPGVSCRSGPCPLSEQVFGDEDFGGTPTLFTATINGVPRARVGALNKDGLFFAGDRNNVAVGPVWQSSVADPKRQPALDRLGQLGREVHLRWRRRRDDHGASCYGNISALDQATGAFVWRSCQTSFMTVGLTEVSGDTHRGCGCG